MTRQPSLRSLGWIVLLLGVLQAPEAYAQSAALTVSGTPPTSVVAGTAYKVTPSVAGGRGARRFFLIRSKPAWASFDWRTGTLSGTPA
jgi:hypothetical protein